MVIAAKLRWRFYLFACLLILLVGCSREAQTIESLPATQVPTATATERPPSRATPAASEIAAGICGEPEGEIAQVTIYPDIPDPRCLKVKPEQKLKVVNQTQSSLEIALGEFKAELAPGREVVWDLPLGEYLQPGVHYLQVIPCCGPEIWLETN